MAHMALEVLGELRLWRDDEVIALPASRKTRALLAYLALTSRPQRRDRLCEMFWDTPDDPRAALRWSLTKLRPLVNGGGHERLLADRERVSLETDGVAIDLFELGGELERAELPLQRLEALARRLAEPLLEGLDLPDQEPYQQWLTAEREELRRTRARAVARLARASELPPDATLAWAQTWLELEPFSATAAATVLATLERLERSTQRAELERTLRARFAQADVQWPAPDRARATPPVADPSRLSRQLLDKQKVRFCVAKDGARIAYATVGSGPPIIKAANWLSHLELDWDAPIWSPLFRELSRRHHLVRYDERGNGLSDWSVNTLSFDAFVTDLETVVEATGLERFALLGISQGAAVSIEYAVRHPERVSQLVLFGGYPAGWRLGATEALTREREAVMTLVGSGWGRDDPAYRQIFSATFMPSATSDELAWFNEFQRRTTSPENAVRFLSAFSQIDVRARLAQVRVPTLVIHSLRDRRIPVETGRSLAASIPGAEFLGLDTDGHLLLGRESASEVFVSAVREFLDRPAPAASLVANPDGLDRHRP